MPSHLTKYQYQKGQPSPNREGRPKSLKTILNQECSLTPSQCNEAILSLLGMTLTQVSQEAENEEAPMFNRIIARAMLKTYKTGSLYVLESLMNRTMGLPRQQTELTTIQEKPIFVSLNLDPI